MYIVLVLIFIPLLVKFQSSGKKIEWIFVHYHKTGHDFSHKLAMSFTSNCPNVHYATKQLHKELPGFAKPGFQALKGEIKVLAAPEMYFNWNEHFSEKNDTVYRILHFVREPYDMVMSGYLYHSQIPTPSSESEWIKNIKFNPCQVDERGLSFIANQLSGSSMIYKKLLESAIHEQLVKIKTLCVDLVAKYKKSNQTTFNLILQAANNTNFYDGVMIEATRAILAAYNGDILRMGINAIYEGRSTDLSLRLFTSDFPIGDRDTFKTNCKRMFKFLMDPHPEVDKPFFSCMNVSTAARHARHALFIPFDHQVSNHVTAGYLSNDSRSFYEAKLQSDPILSPILSLVRGILLPKES